MFECRIEDIPVFIDISSHARGRLYRREVMEYAAYGSIIAVGESILDLKNGDEFAVLDEDLNIALICGVAVESSEIVITVITVIDRANIFIKSGTRIINAPSVLSSTPN